ncbi:MAG: hypothetical protein ABIH37_00425 [archaeon]
MIAAMPLDKTRKPATRFDTGPVPEDNPNSETIEIEHDGRLIPVVVDRIYHDGWNINSVSFSYQGKRHEYITYRDGTDCFIGDRTNARLIRDRGLADAFRYPEKGKKGLPKSAIDVLEEYSAFMMVS